jgi:SAM-dependent methyltransferase
MRSYEGRHAELYDIFYADKAYDKEAAFVHQCLQQYSEGTTRKLLELACGTGSHALALEKKGYDILATDYSTGMLACARRKAAQVCSQVVFCHQDMRSLDLAHEPFDAVICLFDSVGYVATNEALKQVLQGVHHHLRPNGLFVFEFWHAAAMLCHYDPLRVRRFNTPEGEVLRISETTLDCANQLSHITYTVYELRSDGTYTSFQEGQINRYFLVQEMAAWLSSYRFKPVKWFNGFSDDEIITDETWHVVAVAQRDND